MNERNLFRSVRELSYRTDLIQIKDFGRANLPFSSRFYGSLKSSDIQDAMAVNFFEVSREFREGVNSCKPYIFTGGTWITTKKMQVIVLPQNPDLHPIPDEMAADFKILSKLKSDFNLDNYSDQLKYLREVEYAFHRKYITNNCDYWHSALFADYVFKQRLADAILFPSVRTNYKAYNIVMPPWTVENCLEFYRADLFLTTLENRNFEVEQIGQTACLGDCKMIWRLLSKAHDYFIT